MATASSIHEPQTNISISARRCAEGFAALQNALQAGNLAAAREAHAGFWEDVAMETRTRHLFLPDAQTSHDLQAVGHSLGSGDMAGARWAFAMYQKNLVDSSPDAGKPVFHDGGGVAEWNHNVLIPSMIHQH